MSETGDWGGLDSITKHWRALELFTNRRKLIRIFVNRLNESGRENQILFFYGDGGNGKSLLLQYLERHFLKRFAPDEWEMLKNIEDNDEFVNRVKEARGNFTTVPFASLNFGITTGGNDQPKLAFFGLLMLRRELAKYKIRFPLFDYACVWYLHKTEGLSEERLKSLIPAEGLDLAGAIIDYASNTVWGAVAKAAVSVIDRKAKEKYRIWLQQRGIDNAQIEQIELLNPRTELIEYLPQFFAEDLNAFMAQPGAPARLVLFFDTHESFYGTEKDRPEREHFQLDEWFRRLLCELEVSSGIIRVIGGREHPCRKDNNKSWAKARRCKITEAQIDEDFVGHLTPADADESLQKAGVDDADLRASLVRYAEVEENEIHPFYLGLCADIVLAAKRKGKTLTASDFAAHPQIEDQERELIDRFLSYVDDDTKEAVIALSACRAFNKEIFVELGKSLNYHSTNAAFEVLKTFSFVWRVERRGEGWYRIHDLLRVLFADYEPEKVRAAHQFLETYYRQKADDISIVEAIYHANFLDWERGVNEWADVFEKFLELSRYQLCRAMLEVRREMLIEDDFCLGFVSGLEGDFYLSLSLYAQAREEYSEAVAAYDKTLQLIPNAYTAHNNKGIVLAKRGDLEALLTKTDAALQSFAEAVESFNKTLRLVPDYIAAHNNKGNVLRSRGDLEAKLNRVDAALQSYNEAVKSFNKTLQLAPDYIDVHNNKGIVLRSRGDLEALLTRTDAALQSYAEAVESYNKALLLVPDDVAVHNNKGNVLQSRGDLEALLMKTDAALQSYDEAVESFNMALQLAPDYIAAHNNKGITLLSRGDLEVKSNRVEVALQSYNEAVKSYDKALLLAPDYVYAHNNKGNALRSLGDLEAKLNKVDRALQSYDEAVKSYDKALQLAPDYIDAHYNKGHMQQSRALLRISLGQTVEACQDLAASLTEFSRLFEIAPDDKEIQNLRQEVEELINEHCREKPPETTAE